uniref:WS_DGAT_C domain-containing protein n=1 Tax=Panagrellus redivivus TaxID=6233 RepID=A0A7E4UP31_PANRE
MDDPSCGSSAFITGPALRRFGAVRTVKGILYRLGPENINTVEGTGMPARWPMTRTMPGRWPMIPPRSFEVDPDVPSHVSRLFVQTFHYANCNRSILIISGPVLIQSSLIECLSDQLYKFHFSAHPYDSMHAATGPKPQNVTLVEIPRPENNMTLAAMSLDENPRPGNNMTLAAMSLDKNPRPGNNMTLAAMFLDKVPRFGATCVHIMALNSLDEIPRPGNNMTLAAMLTSQSERELRRIRRSVEPQRPRQTSFNEQAWAWKLPISESNLCSDILDLGPVGFSVATVNPLSVVVVRDLVRGEAFEVQLHSDLPSKINWHPHITLAPWANGFGNGILVHEKQSNSTFVIDLKKDVLQKLDLEAEKTAFGSLLDKFKPNSC